VDHRQAPQVPVQAILSDQVVSVVAAVSLVDPDCYAASALVTSLMSRCEQPPLTLHAAGI
jgi:hypothetical protein